MTSISGTIESLGSGSIIVQDGQGFWRTVAIASTTTFSEGPMNVAPAITASNLAVGETVTVSGAVDANHTTLDATAIKIHLAEVDGTVTSVSPTALVVNTRHNSQPVTIAVSSTTVVFNHSGIIPISMIKTGSVIAGFGLLQSDGSLSAIYVALVPTHGKFDVEHLSGFTLPNRFFHHHYAGHNDKK